MKSDSEKTKKNEQQTSASGSCYFEWLADTEKKVYKAWNKKS